MRIFHRLDVVGTGEAAIAEVAAVQRGLVTRKQLLAAGFSDGRIRRMVRRGTLLFVLPRVYALGHQAPGTLVDEVAAMLYVAHDAALSHRTAAAIWDIAERASIVDVTIVGRDSRRHEGLATYRVPHLDSRDVRLRHGLPLTAPARTLIDFAASAGPIELDGALHRARAAELVGDTELDDALERAPRRTGTAAMHRLLSNPLGRVLLRSRFERALAALLQDSGLPLPEFNVRVNEATVDALWREQRLVLECDSWEFHGGREAFETDRARDQRHAAAGYRVVRITWRQLTEQPLLVAARIAAALAATAG